MLTGSGSEIVAVCDPLPKRNNKSKIAIVTLSVNISWKPFMINFKKKSSATIPNCLALLLSISVNSHNRTFTITCG